MQSIIFSVDGREDLVPKVVNEINALTGWEGHNITIGSVNPQVFSDGEVCVDFETSVRGKRVYLISSPNNSDKIMQLNFAIDAAKRAGAKEIVAVLPYFPYARQDKKDQVRGPIGAKVLAEMLENRGATQIITFDLHADQIQGFFNIPVMHMEGKYLFDRNIYDICGEGEDVDVVLCAPDAGAAKRVKHFRDQIRERWGIDIPMVMIDKTRPKANEVGEMVLIGDVTGKIVLIIDDMCDTGGTLIKAAEELKKHGATAVSAIVTHGVLSGDAMTKIWNAVHEEVLTEFICSDSLPVGGKRFFVEQGVNPEGSQLLTIVSTAKQIAKAILSIDNNMSIEKLKHNEQ